jgi:hypothetical protein
MSLKCILSSSLKIASGDVRDVDAGIRTVLDLLHCGITSLVLNDNQSTESTEVYIAIFVIKAMLILTY